MLHNLRKKVIIIFLSCFLVISSATSSFAFAPLVALAPEVFSLVATTLVCAGVKFADYKALNRSVRDVYETEGFITKCLPQIENDIKNAKDGVVTLSSSVADWFNTNFFPSVVSGSNAIFSNIPCYFPSVNEYWIFYNQLDASSISISPIYTFDISTYSKFQVVENLYLQHDANSQYVKLLYNDKVLETYYCQTKIGWDGRVALIYNLDLSNNPSAPCVKFAYTYQKSGHLAWMVVGNSISDMILEVDSSSSLSNVYDWNNSSDVIDYVLNPNLNGDFDVPVAGDVSDLIGQDVWSPSIDQIWNPSFPIEIPNVAEGDLVEEGDYIIPPSPEPPDPDPDDPDNPDPDNPEKPPFYVPEQDGIDFTPILSLCLKFTEKFPFSLVWDFKRIFDFFDVSPKAPIWTIPIITEKVVIDLTRFSAFADITKFFVYVGFCVVLIFIFNKIRS